MRRFKPFSLALTLALCWLPSSAAFAQQTQTFSPSRVAPAAASSAHAGATLPASEINAAQYITAARLSEYLHFVASDAMQGRDTPSPGLDATAKYLAEHLQRAGLKPAGDNGTYFQRIVLRRNKVDAARTNATLGNRAFSYGADFLVASRKPAAAGGALVYVGHGWVVKAKNINAYEGIDVRDKIVVVSGGGLPPGVTRADLEGKSDDDWSNPETYARAHGAKGMLFIPRARELDHWWHARMAASERGGYEVARFVEGQPDDNSSLPSIIASAAMLDALFAGEPHNGAELLQRARKGDPAPAFALSPNKTLQLTIDATSDTRDAQNVVAALEGKDPLLKREYVALGAHYDHVGIGLPVNGDAIYNGADDDGSGTVSVLALAEAFARGPRPRRSILFVWHCGEEKGLWGSRYFTQYPTVPLDEIVTQLNIDMIGRSKKFGDANPLDRELSGPNEIYVIGSKMMSTELGALSERVNRAYLDLSFNYRYDDPSDPNRFFFRSDHFNYAHKGIPIIFYFDGVHEDYHRPSDSPDKIDYQKMEKVARTIFLTASELANANARPRVDKQLPPELSDK